MNLFAIIENGGEETIYRIPLSQEVQSEINTQFEQLSVNFFAEQNIIDFNGSYNPDEDELFEIRNYPMSPNITDSVTNNLNYEILDLENLFGRIKAVYASKIENGLIEIYFQSFDTKKIIANRGIPLFNYNGTFTRFENKGIAILNNLTIVFKQNNIYFKSYYNARRVVPLDNYYLEATESDVAQFSSDKILSFEDPDGFIDNLNSRLRKKIKSILNNGTLQQLSTEDIQIKANELGIELTFHNGQVYIPKDKHYLNQFIKFLDEDYFITPITNRKCVTNSKREIN
jgi:hypothetical protein